LVEIRLNIPPEHEGRRVDFDGTCADWRNVQRAEIEVKKTAYPSIRKLAFKTGTGAFTVLTAPIFPV